MGYPRVAMSDKAAPRVDPKLLEDPVFLELLADGLAIQHRFAAEPVYAKTGKGFLKSEGVEEIRKSKDRRIRRH